MGQVTRSPCALRLRGVSKTFPGVRALEGVNLEIAPGEIHALLGQNGCGKSTLIKVLAGFHRPDPGASAEVDGAPLELGSAAAAERAGIRFVHQNLGLVVELSAVDNIAMALGYARTRLGSISWGEQARRTRQLLDEFGIDLDIAVPLSTTSPVERTIVAIVRALAGWTRGRGLLVLDEPTAALPVAEVRRLFELLRRVSGSGTAVLYVSHRMDEISEIADRATVLRSGRNVGTAAIGDTSAREIARMIAGKTIHADARMASTPRGDRVLSVRGLRSASLAPTDLDLHAGEIVGVAGLAGSGRDEVAYALTGTRTARGEWRVGEARLTSMTPVTAARVGIGFVPGDREREAIVPEMTVGENLSLVMLPRLRHNGALSGRAERRGIRAWLGELGIPGEAIDRPVRELSGGNQQKVVMARWLWSRPRVLVLCEPTAGVDIGARQALYGFINACAGDGLAVMVASSDVEDLVRLCSRVLVLRDGRVARELREGMVNTREIVRAIEGADNA